MSSAPSIRAHVTVVGAAESLHCQGNVWLLFKGLQVPAVKHDQDNLLFVGSLLLCKEEGRIKQHACWTTVQISCVARCIGCNYSLC